MSAPAIDTDVFLQSLALVESHPDYRVLHRFESREWYRVGSHPQDLAFGLYVDVEATGLDTDTDEIIEIGLVPFTFDRRLDVIVKAGAPHSFFEQPAKALPAEITEITGITPEMVAGQRIPDDTVESLANASALIIAHSARYDRKMIERRFPAFAPKHWACSQEEVPWRQFGVAGGALLNIAMTTCGVFTEGAHRAAHDCQLGIHVLATAQCEGRSAFSYLIESARKPLRRVRAMGSPRWAAGWLKAHGYRARYVGDAFQYWYKDFPASASEVDVDAEVALCAEHAQADPDVQLISGVDKYSVRA